MAKILELTEIRVENFLSIRDEVDIPVQKYGNSYTTIFVGKNDSGKTNLLKALAFLSEEDKPIKYTNICHRDYKNEDNKYIDIYYEFKVINNKEILNIIKGINIFPENFLSTLKILNITKNLYARKDMTSVESLLTFNIQLSEKSKNYYAVLNNENSVTSIEIKGQAGLLGKEIPENGKELTKDLIEKYLKDKIGKELNKYLPQFITWKSDDKHLIFNDNPNLQLNNFVNNPNSLVPLKNMFLIAGYNETTLVNAINNALEDVDSRSELESELSTKTTEYISKVWANQNVKISVRISDTGKCTIQIEDTSSRYFDMKLKSDGFKQFISLILSLSAENSVKKLSDTLILIDEPETHLYPESIEDMKRELLKIGENNYVFISTHSPFMIDRECSERHWKIEKNGIKTFATQISDSISMWDNKVLNSAFGLNIFRELLPQKIIIVEGNDDKQILEKLFKVTNIKDHYAIKSSGGASHMINLATMFCGEKVYPYFIVDDDQEGRKNKSEIIKRNCYRNRIFTLKDLVNKEYDKFTLEDLYPLNLVKTFFDEKCEKDFNLNNQAPVLAQILNQDPSLKRDKDRCNNLKYELADLICSKITKNNLSSDFPLLNELINKFKATLVEE